MLTAASPEPGRLVTATVERLDLPSLNARQAILDAAITPESFARAFADQSVLHAVEVRHPAIPARPGREARVVFWNAERLKYLDNVDRHARGAERRRRSCCARSMSAWPARATGTRSADLANAMSAQATCSGSSSWSWAWATLASAPSSRARTTRPGCMARAFVSRAALQQAGPGAAGDLGPLVRRRVSTSAGSAGGSRCWPRSTLAGVPVLLVAAHYESHSDPADRLLQTTIDARRHRPPLAGKARADRRRFQHQHLRPREESDAAHVAAALAADPDRLVAPDGVRTDVRLSGRARLRLGELQRARSPTRSGPGPTAPRSRPSARSTGYFSRGLRCTDPAIIPAVDAEGIGDLGPRGARRHDHSCLRQAMAIPAARQRSWPHPCLRPSRPQRRRA